jgi:hypothetical protein
MVRKKSNRVHAESLSNQIERLFCCSVCGYCANIFIALKFLNSKKCLLATESWSKGVRHRSSAKNHASLFQHIFKRFYCLLTAIKSASHAGPSDRRRRGKACHAFCVPRSSSPQLSLSWLSFADRGAARPFQPLPLFGLPAGSATALADALCRLTLGAGARSPSRAISGRIASHSRAARKGQLYIDADVYNWGQSSIAPKPLWSVSAR